jgi:hypothetical protein
MSELALLEQDARETQEAMLNTPVGIIDRALERLAKPNHWRKDEYATRSDGSRCSSDDPDAVSYCLLGAIGSDACDTPCDPYLALKFVRHAIAQHEGRAPLEVVIDEFNDDPDTNYEKVVAVLNRARELAVAAESEASDGR